MSTDELRAYRAHRDEGEAALRSENARLREQLEAEKREADALRSERDDRRKSLAQEIRQALITRGFHAPKDDRPESDLIGAVGMALDGLRELLRECRPVIDQATERTRDVFVAQRTNDLSRRVSAALKETT